MSVPNLSARWVWGLNVKEKPALLGSREGWEQVVVTGKVSIQYDWVGLTPPSGVLQSSVALISLTPCFTSLQLPGTLRNLLMRSNYEKCQGFNQLWMYGWRVQLNLPERMHTEQDLLWITEQISLLLPNFSPTGPSSPFIAPHSPLFLFFLPPRCCHTAVDFSCRPPLPTSWNYRTSRKL